MAEITTYLAILTLNVNNLNIPIKRHQHANWIKKEGPATGCLYETQLTDRKKHCLRVKDGKRFTKLMAPQNKQK
jgi:hypothetical protein